MSRWAVSDPQSADKDDGDTVMAAILFALRIAFTIAFAFVGPLALVCFAGTVVAVLARKK